MPPTTTTTKMIEPTIAAIEGSVTKVMPPTTPANAAKAQPLPNTSMNTRGTLWPRASTISGWPRAAWMTRPMRVRVSSSHSASSITSATSHHEHARGREGRAAHQRRAHAGALFGAGRTPGQAQAVARGLNDREGCALQGLGRRHRQRRQAPDQLDQFQDHVGQAERDQQLGHMAELVHPAQRGALEQRAEQRPPGSARRPVRPRSRTARSAHSRSRRPACRSWHGQSSARPSC